MPDRESQNEPAIYPGYYPPNIFETASKTAHSGKALEFSDELKVVVTYLAIHELKLGSRRLRRRGKGQIEQLASNIRRFGLIVPVIITPNGTIIDGHAIVEAAREAGVKQIPTISLSHLNEAELRACRIALNRIQEMSIWDEAELKREVEFLIEVDIDLVSFTGFTTPQIDFILDPVGRKPKWMRPTSCLSRWRPSCRDQAMSGSSRAAIALSVATPETQRLS